MRCKGGRPWGTPKYKFPDPAHQVLGSLAVVRLPAFLPAWGSDRPFRPPHDAPHLPDAPVRNFLPAGTPSAPSLPVSPSVFEIQADF